MNLASATPAPQLHHAPTTVVPHPRLRMARSWVKVGDRRSEYGASTDFATHKRGDTALRFIGSEPSRAPRAQPGDRHLYTAQNPDTEPLFGLGKCSNSQRTVVLCMAADLLAARGGLTPRKSANASPVGHKLWPTVELWVVDEFFDPLAGSPPMT